ncbi:MAG: GntR family transcriptional regulator [bacterium]|nr:GntR family transcriptional regulator [bacterium]
MISRANRRNKGPEPIYRHLQESIIAKVRKGDFKPDDALSSENELAEEYGISRGSVRTALKELQDKGVIYSVAGKGSFVSRQISDQSVSKQDRIAFIVPSLDGSDLQIYRGIEDTLNTEGFILSIFNSQRSIEQENKNLKLLLEGKEKGAIIFPNWGRTNAEALFELKMAGYPFVLIDRYFRELETDYVVTDNKKGGFLATEHLIKLGHKRIGIVLGLNCTAIEDRFEGYREALAQHDIVHDPALVRRFQRDDAEENEPSAETGYNEAVDLLNDKPTAIFATNDFLARGTIKAIQDAGMNIPGDISVIGFDNQGFAERLNPALTTVAQPFYELGQRATRMLLVKISSDNSKEGCIKKVLSPELVFRRSS